MCDNPKDNLRGTFHGAMYLVKEGGKTGQRQAVLLTRLKGAMIQEPEETEVERSSVMVA